MLLHCSIHRAVPPSWIVMSSDCAGAGNDYQKDMQFKKLNAAKDSIEIKVLRNGVELLIPNTDILVGDVLLLDTGDKIAADGIAFQSYGLVVDEASLTGESEPQHKGNDDPWCLSGTQVIKHC
jgi:Ca2+-transporting ATPase